VASVGNIQGTIRAFDATATNAVELWAVTNPDYEGFFGGVVITKEGFLYAATYDFWGEEDNSTLFKIDCADGNIVWTESTERTDTIPVVVGDRIYISGGINDSDSRQKLESYQDNGSSASKLWETDANLFIGGYSNQPVYANGKLYVGATSQGGTTGEYDELYILDVLATPDDANFIIAHYTDKKCGNSPVVIYDSIYTMGYDGLLKFHQQGFLGDISKDSEVDMNDAAELLEDWLWDGAIGANRADLNLDGKVNFSDFALLANEWRFD